MYNLPLAPKKSKLCFHHCDQLHQPGAAAEGGTAPDGVSPAAILLSTTVRRVRCRQQRFCSEQQCGTFGVASSDSALNNSAGCLVVKMTDNVVCLQYKTDLAQDVKKMDKFVNNLMRHMASKEQH